MEIISNVSGTAKLPTMALLWPRSETPRAMRIVALLEWLDSNLVGDGPAEKLVVLVNNMLDAEHTDHNSTQHLPRTKQQMLKEVAPVGLVPDDVTKDASSADFLHMDIVDPAGEFKPATNVMGDPFVNWCDLMSSPVVVPSRDVTVDAASRWVNGSQVWGEMMSGDLMNNTQVHER